MKNSHGKGITIEIYYDGVSIDTLHLTEAGASTYLDSVLKQVKESIINATPENIKKWQEELDIIKHMVSFSYFMGLMDEKYNREEFLKEIEEMRIV